LENVLNGAFTIAEKLFGITFKEVFDIDTYHEDVQTFEVLDFEGNLVAVFYSDFFPRKGKRNGAWMTSYKPQYIQNGVNERPHISNVCNFTRPTATKPSLLTFNEFCNYTKSTPRTGRYLISRKLIPYVKVGKFLRFRQSDIDKFLREHTVEALPKAVRK
jgi:excisionase family DNA binding protein